MKGLLKVPLADLQEALRNPRAFVRGQGKAGSFGPSRFMALRNVALNFHKENDLDRPIRDLEERLQKFKTTRNNDAYVEKLRAYAWSFKELGTTVAGVRNTVKLSIPDEYAQFQVTGQVARLDVDPAGGYRAWILASKTAEWRDELRFPLMQSACATQMDVDVEEIVPGVYDFSTGTYSVVRSSKRKVQETRRQLLALLDEMKKHHP